MVKVYLMDVLDLPDPAEYPEKMGILTKVRREKILRYKKVKDRKLSLGAGLLLNQCLEENGIHVDEIRYGKNGKPELDTINFNLSHSHDLVVCAVSDKPVGCDIEKTGKMRDGVAEHFFTENEVKYLNQFDGKEKNEEFYRIWTIKESYLKMTGEGMRIPLDSIEVLFEDEIKIRRDGIICGCHIKEYKIPGYKLTVCGEEDVFSDYLERREAHEEG